MGLVKVLLFTLIFALRSEVGFAQDVSAVELREFATPTGSLVLTLDALKPSITTDSNANETSTAKTGLVPTTSGDGTGAVITIVGHGTTTGIKDITVTCGGSGYKVGDTLTIAASAVVSSVNIVITLQAGDIAATGPVGSLKSSIDALKTSITQNSGGNEGTTETKNLGTTNTRSGTGAIIAITGEANGGTTGATTLRVTTCGSGYRPGDVVSIAASGLNGTNDIKITLVPDDIEGYVKTISSTGGYRTSEGALFGSNGNFVGNTLTGYYAALHKTTNHIQVKATFSTVGSLGGTLGITSETSFTTTVPSATFFPVSDGINYLKLISSKDGTYVISLIKPDDEIKAMEKSDRSIGIAYNPAAVGEFTCAAHADGATAPTTRALVKSGGVADSVNTYKIMQAEIYNSIQLVLNGLTPDTTYDIYCFHGAHGIISKTDASVKTGLGSLSGVSLLPTGNDFTGAYTSLTLKFTHEKSLTVNDLITLTLYNDYDTVQSLAVSSTAATCGGQLTIKSGGSVITGTHECSSGGTNNAYPLTIKLKGPSTVIDSGMEVEILLTDDSSNLNLANNAAAGTKVTFDLEVTGHGKLVHEEGWTTT
eukprot:g11056.t1